MFKKNRNQNGQIALMVVLSLLVGSAVVLSVVSRTITEARLTSEQDTSSKTLRVAEAGVEEALRTLSDVNFGGTLNGQSYLVSVAPGASSEGYISGRPIVAGEMLEVNLVGANAKSLNIFVGDKADVSQQPPAAVQLVLYVAGGTKTITTKADKTKTLYLDSDVVYYDYDWDPVRLEGNFFDDVKSNQGGVTGTIPFLGVNFAMMVNLQLTGREVALRIKPFYNQATIGVQAVGKVKNAVSYYLPSQQYKATVTAKGEGNVEKKIEVTRSLPALPEIFDAALYSGVGLGQ